MLVNVLNRFIFSRECYVNFQTLSEALSVVKHLNGKTVMHKLVRVEIVNT